MAAQAFGKYQLLRKLATGGMAEVFLARQTGIEGFNRLCVVKRILPHLAEDSEFVEMFLNEARIAARFSHPNIGQIYDLGSQNGAYYIAMEYIHGEDLGRVMRKAWADGKWILEHHALRIIASCCEGLSYAHNRTDESGRPLRVVHRDISPQNILISFDGSVKLVDFGIAKAADMPSLTRSGAIKGKFAYMAPEQAAGKPLDHRSDLFAIGLVLYELLTGVRPLKKDNEIATLQAALECNIPPPSEVAELSPALDAVVMRALKKAPADRYGDARELQLALEQHLLQTRKIATSVQLSELMRELFAERLAEEARSGQPEPAAEGSVPGGSDARTVPPEELSWEAPPGEAIPPTRARPPTRVAEPSRTSLTAQTTLARAPSRPDHPRARGGAVMKTRTQPGEQEEAAAPRAPPRRLSGTQNTVVPGMPEAPPRRSQERLRAATVTPARQPVTDAGREPAPLPPRTEQALADYVDVERIKARQQRRLRQVLGISAAAALVLCAVVFSEPILATVRGSGIDPNGVYVTVETNLPVRVYVEHHPSENAAVARRELTFLETTHAPRLTGAHLRDTLVLVNEARGLRYTHELKFGAPQQEVLVRKEFKPGRVDLQLLPPLSGIRVHVDGKDTGRDASIPFDLIEGPHTLELRGEALREPVKLDVTVFPDRTISPTVKLPVKRG